jgi:CubicO group peptidase (beta-lactamase class C family)
VKRFGLILLSAIAWITIVGFGAINGWWLTPIATRGDARAFMNAATSKVTTQNRGNIAIVMLRNGAVFGEHYASLRDTINLNTRFPLASMSKWFTAYGVMQLVEAGTISLDAPVSTYLRQWQLPPGAFNNDSVTVRRLLSHTAALTDALGFGDYTSNEVLPTTSESLRHPRASRGRTATIAVGEKPGTAWTYSGGGYLILQALVEDVTGKPFAEQMQRAVFNPLGMQRASYAYLGSLDNTSKSYDSTGTLAPSYQYAAAAATGLAASAQDLVIFAQAQMDSGRAGALPVRASTITAMRQALGRKFGADIWGLGVMLYAPTSSGDFIFGHDGSNQPAINTTLRINPDNHDAIIVLTTGNPMLASSIGYEWTLWQTGSPDFLMIDKALSSAIIPLVLGLAFIAAIAATLHMRQRRVVRGRM